MSEDEAFERTLKEPRVNFASMQFARRRAAMSTLDEYERIERLNVRRLLKRQMRKVGV
jgi:hypothetical protein